MMAMIDDVVVFLRARLDEDTAAAKATIDVIAMSSLRRDTATIPRWIADLDGPGIIDEAGIRRVRHTWTPERDHIVRHDPARVLVDVAAKRAIIDAFEEARLNVFGYRAGGLLIAVRHLAAAFADHPDYRKEWDA